MDTKSLSDADLGINKKGNQTHIGLTENMIPIEKLGSETNGYKKEFTAKLFIEGEPTPHTTVACIAPIKRSNGTYTSPNIKTGGQGVAEKDSLLKLIRKHAVIGNEVKFRNLSVGLTTDTIIAYLHNCDAIYPTQSVLFNGYSVTERKIYESSVIKEFCRSVIIHLIKKHKDKFEKLLSKNGTSAEHLDLDSLTRIIRTSVRQLDKEDLSANGKPRYFEDPINHDPFWYLSGEWYGNDTDKLLCFIKLAKVIEDHFPKYYLKQERGTYYFIEKKSISSVNYELPTELGIPLLPNTCTSLLAKPFTILTGASGTGKTKIAQSLVKHYGNGDETFSNSAVVAVGADWTDNRNTLGFVNHLNKDCAENPIYQSTEILNLMLRANKNPDFPYFLILDEMNLSHVERYFADFLSVMEQKNGKFHLHDEAEELTNSSSEGELVPQHLDYPQNLFVIGTVNIDETTYMFSPKVLDRANVIEFKVNEADIEKFLADPQEPADVEHAAAGQAEAFLQFAKDARSGELDKLEGELKTALNKHLLDLFNIMQQGRFEFAYRTANEITRYMRVCQKLASDEGKLEEWKSTDWEANFDEQIVQKVLPKLHGSIGRVGKLIAKLAHFCHNPADTPKDSLQGVIETLKEADAKYPKSFAKLQSMAATLREEQFVSFIH